MTPEDQTSAAQALLNAEKQRAQIGLLSQQYPEMKNRMPMLSRT